MLNLHFELEFRIKISYWNFEFFSIFDYAQDVFAYSSSVLTACFSRIYIKFKKKRLSSKDPFVLNKI